MRLATHAQTVTHMVTHTATHTAAHTAARTAMLPIAHTLTIAHTHRTYTECRAPTLVHLPVCAHAHCQALCDEILRGNLDADVPQIVLPTPYLHGDVLRMCRLVAAAAVPIDLLGWRPVEWTQPSSMIDDEMQEDYQAQVSFLAAFYSIPTVKLQLRLLFYLLYVVFVSIACMATHSDVYEADEDDPRMSMFHRGGGIGDERTALALLIWTIALGLDQWDQLIKSSGSFRAWWGNFWSRFDCATIAATLVALAFRFHDLTSAVEIMSFVVLCIWFRIFKLLSHDHDVGPLVVMIAEMMKDVKVWCQVQVIIIGAFLVAFVSVSEPKEVAEADETPITVVIWSMFNIFDPPTMYSFNSRVGAPLLFVYCFVMCILMINLLLALLANTIGEIQGHADEVWKMERLNTALVAVERWSKAPPPLNLPWTLASFFRSVYMSCLGGCQPKSNDYVVDDAEKDRLSEMKVRKARTVDSLILKMHLEHNLQEEEAVPAIVREIASNVSALFDRSTSMDQALKEVKDEVQQGGDRRMSMHRRRSSVASHAAMEVVSRSALRRFSRQTSVSADI